MSAATFPEATLAKWRALVEKDLAGKPFDKTLVSEALAGVTIAPLYTDAPPLDPAARHDRGAPVRICLRHDATSSAGDVVADVTGGADAIWLPFSSALREAPELANTALVLEATKVPSPASVVGPFVYLAVDPIGWRARGIATGRELRTELAAVGRLAATVRGTPTVVVSTEPYHDAGADAADEIALALSTGTAYLESLLEAGLTVEDAAGAMALRVTVGRDTFVELCKLRALRVCWTKVLAASGAAATRPAIVHAVCSAQTVSTRDPWVNLLRVTTQMFAAIVGGADLVTPSVFDGAFETTSALGRRVARNTGLVLREESGLDKVADPAAGSYHFDTLTDSLARQAWTRFQGFSRRGGVAKLVESGELAGELEASWRQRLGKIATRKVAIVGVSEFANLDEKLPHAAPSSDAAARAGALPVHRDAASFEALRLRAEALPTPPEALLVTLGAFADSRPRVGFAATFFSAGGIRTKETADVGPAVVACLCGSDAAYAEGGAVCAAALKRAGVKRVVLAGRPGPLEPALREAGVDGFVFVGGDVAGALGDLLSAYAEVTS